VTVTNKSQKGIRAVNFTVGDWAKGFYECHYFPGDILEVQTD